VSDRLSTPDRLDGGPAPGIEGAEAMRRAMAGMYLAGAVTLGLVLLAPDRDTSDHPALALLAVVFAAIAVPLFAWRNAPDRVLAGGVALGVVCISITVGVVRPMVLTPIFYIWSMLLAASYLSRRQIAFQYVLMVVLFAASLAFLAAPADRTIAFVSVCAMVAVIVFVIVRLRERNEALVAQLRTLATRDPLTGVLNRGAFEEHLRAERARALRHGRPLAVVAIDLDHFKQVNDRDGHAAGDEALQLVARLIGDNTRASDVFARVGGEEFALLLPDTDVDRAERIAEQLRVLVERESGSRPNPLTISAGVASMSGGADGETMLAADRALYEAKRLGRNRVVREAPTAPGAVEATGARG
jgi:diguanylate cyclase (GGDEF)-like protein